MWLYLALGDKFNKLWIQGIAFVDASDSVFVVMGKKASRGTDRFLGLKLGHVSFYLSSAKTIIVMGIFNHVLLNNTEFTVGRVLVRASN